MNYGNEVVQGDQRGWKWVLDAMRLGSNEGAPAVAFTVDFTLDGGVCVHHEWGDTDDGSFSSWAHALDPENWVDLPEALARAAGEAWLKNGNPRAAWSSRMASIPPADVREWLRVEARRVLALTSLAGSEGAALADEQFQHGGAWTRARGMKVRAEERAAFHASESRA